MNPNVWLIRESRNDVSRLSEYGTLCVIYQKGTNPLDMRTQSFIIDSEVLPVYRPEDYVVIDGPGIMVALLIARLSNVTPKIKVLAYSPKNGKFVERELQTCSLSSE